MAFYESNFHIVTIRFSYLCKTTPVFIQKHVDADSDTTRRTRFKANFGSKWEACSQLISEFFFQMSKRNAREFDIRTLFAQAASLMSEEVDVRLRTRILFLVNNGRCRTLTDSPGQSIVWTAAGVAKFYGGVMWTPAAVPPHGDYPFSASNSRRWWWCSRYS